MNDAYDQHNNHDLDDVKILDVTSQDIDDYSDDHIDENTTPHHDGHRSASASNSTRGNADTTTPSAQGNTPHQHRELIEQKFSSHAGELTDQTSNSSKHYTPFDQANKANDSSSTTASRPWKVTESLITWIALLAAIALRLISEIGRLGGQNTIEMTKQDLSAFTFPPFIYLAQIVAYVALGVWLLFTMGSHERKQLKLFSLPLSSYGLLFIGICFLDIVWSLSWHFQQFSVAIVAGVLFIVGLVSLHTMLRHHHLGMWRIAPLGLALGWYLSMFAFTIAHTSSHYADSTGKAFWQIPLMFILLALLFLASYFMRIHGEWLTGLGTLWVSIGIAMRTMDYSKFTAIMVILITVAGAIFIYLPWKRFTLQEASEAESSKQH